MESYKYRERINIKRHMPCEQSKREKVKTGQIESPRYEILKWTDFNTETRQAALKQTRSTKKKL